MQHFPTTAPPEGDDPVAEPRSRLRWGRKASSLKPMEAATGTERRRKRRRRLAIGSVVVAVLGLVLVRALEQRMVFIPTRAVVERPEDYGLEARDVFMETPDGVQIHALFFPRPDARATVLYFHGNAGNISSRIQVAAHLGELGLQTMLVEYRGYGRSKGRPSERGLYTDATTAWRHLTQVEAIPADQILIWGRSLGGAVATELATHVHPRALVVESTFTRITEVAADIFPRLPVGRVMSVEFPSIERIGSLDVPVLVAHSQHDRLVHYHHGRRLFDAIQGPRQFVELHGDHNDGRVTLPRYAPEVREFLDHVDATVGHAPAGH